MVNFALFFPVYILPRYCLLTPIVNVTMFLAVYILSHNYLQIHLSLNQGNRQLLQNISNCAIEIVQEINEH